MWPKSAYNSCDNLILLRTKMDFYVNDALDIFFYVITFELSWDHHMSMDLYERAW